MKLTKYFKSPQQLADYLNGKTLPSNVLAVVLSEDGQDIDEIQFSTNDVTKVFTKFVTFNDADVERLQEELEEAEETIATQATQIHDLQQDVEEWHDKWDTCYRELQTANETIATQSATITTQQETIATLNAAITSQASEIQTLTEQLATANATITSLQADLTNYDNQLQAI